MGLAKLEWETVVGREWYEHRKSGSGHLLKRFEIFLLKCIAVLKVVYLVDSLIIGLGSNNTSFFAERLHLLRIEPPSNLCHCIVLDRDNILNVLF